MSTIRRFLVAPALVRLIRKERGGVRITEGHFAPQGGRASYVRVEGQACQLVLVSGGGEERTDVPRAHGDALLDVCPGRAVYDRTALSVSGHEVQIDRYVTPGSFDLISVAFDGEAEAAAFGAPVWFGREVSAEPTYERQSLAIQGVPAAEEVALGNAALDAVLDLIEPRFGFGRYGSPARAPESDDGAAPRRVAPPAAAPAPVPVPVVPAPPEPTAVEPPASAAPAVELPPAAAEPPPAAVEPPAHQAEPVAPAAAAEAASEPAAPQPADAPEAAPHADARPATPAEAVHGDARIDDVIESLSQALGAAIQQHPDPAAGEGAKGDGKGDGKTDDPGSVFERWTVRPRRTQQT